MSFWRSFLNFLARASGVKGQGSLWEGQIFKIGIFEFGYLAKNCERKEPFFFRMLIISGGKVAKTKYHNCSFVYEKHNKCKKINLPINI